MQKKRCKGIRKLFFLGMIVLMLAQAALPAQVSAATASIKLNKKKATVLVGGTVKLKATVTGKSKKVTWKSGNKKIATVDKNGKVTGKKAGTVKITAKANGKQVKCTVTVQKRPAYAKVYAAWLKKHPAFTPSDYWDAACNPTDKTYVNSFYLYDIDKDKTPELFTFTNVNFRWFIVRIYTCSDGKIKPFLFKDGKEAVFDDNSSANGAYRFYICKNGHVHNEYGGGMVRYFYAYKNSGGKLKEYLYKEEMGQMLGGKETFRKNGKEISADTYSSLTKNCEERTMADYKNTGENRSKLKKGNCKVN